MRIGVRVNEAPKFWQNEISDRLGRIVHQGEDLLNQLIIVDVVGQNPVPADMYCWIVMPEKLKEMRSG